MRQLDSRWLKGIEPEDRATFEQALRTSTLVLGRLLAILEDEYANILRQEETESSLSNPNWSNQLAYRIGERARLNKTIALLKFLKE